MGIKKDPEGEYAIMPPDMLAASPGALLFITSSPMSVVGQLHDMAHYLAEDGFVSFWMWMQARYPELKELSPEPIKNNVEHMIDACHDFGGGCEHTGKM